MNRNLGRYAEYVEHPRFGREPRFTGIDVNDNLPGVHLHWINGIGSYDDGTRLVAGTAIQADLARQTPATFPVTHYYDLDKLCRDCDRRFIFFAEEQKHWYEELGFPLEANCIRCPTCRKKLQVIAKKRQRYEALFHVANRCDEENLDMADCCLILIEEGIFGHQQLERVRMLLKRISAERRLDSKFRSLTERLQETETKKREQNAAPKGRSGPR